MSEQPNVNDFEENQGSIDKLKSKDATIDKLKSDSIEVKSLTAEFLKLKNQIELLNTELKVVKDSKQLLKFSSNRTDIDTPLYNNNVLVSVPIGSIIAFGGKIIPDGWLICDGRRIDYSEYENLHKIIGDYIPDMNNRFIMGISDDENLNATWKNRYGGKSNIRINVQNLPPHSHDLNLSFSIRELNYKSASDGMTGSGASKITNETTQSIKMSSTGSKEDTFKSDPIDIIPPYFKLIYIIKAK